MPILKDRFYLKLATLKWFIRQVIKPEYSCRASSMLLLLMPCYFCPSAATVWTKQNNRVLAIHAEGIKLPAWSHYREMIYIYICIKWTVFVNVTTKSAQHAHAWMIAIIVEKSPNSSHMYDHGFMDNTNRQAVKNWLDSQTRDASLTSWRQPFCKFTKWLYTIQFYIHVSWHESMYHIAWTNRINFDHEC